MNYIKTGLVLFLMVGCAQLDIAKHTKKMEFNQSIGKNLVAHKYGDVYFSGQPTNDDIKALRKEGFKHIINLRKQNEEDYSASSEASMVRKNEIEYSHTPMDLRQPLTDTYIKSVTEKVRAFQNKGKTLVHCSSGQRAALWAGGHFYKDHGYSKDQVERMTKKMGLEKPALKEKLTEYTTK
jgi:uncharacterized protein (TIGR01244 family)